MKKKNYIALLVMLMITFATNGQVVPPPMPPPPPPGLPIDGGVFFLIVSAIAYGVKKIKE